MNIFKNATPGDLNNIIISKPSGSANGAESIDLVIRDLQCDNKAHIIKAQLCRANQDFSTSTLLTFWSR